MRCVDTGECFSNSNFVNIVVFQASACDLEALGRVKQIDRITDFDLKGPAAEIKLPSHVVGRMSLPALSRPVRDPF
jgi:hypothetical protein